VIDKVSRTCTVCAHVDRSAIDAALVARLDSIRDIAGQYGLKRASLDRHRQAHIPVALAQATQAAEVVEATSLLDQVRALLADARRIQQAAEAAKDLRTALSAVREQARTLELLARLLGELESSTTVTVNVNQAATELSTEELESYSEQLAELAQEQRDARALLAAGSEVTP
jgi:hypothetical protein